jgi:putative salt-induced outer membrane protein YdiY
MIGLPQSPSRGPGLFIALCALLLIAPQAIAQLELDSAYTDRIFLHNGDVLTGNIKELDRGKLRFKTRTMDTVYINWVDIKYIESDKYLRIERTDGTFNYGRIQAVEEQKGLVVQQGQDKVDVPLLAVATVQPIRAQESFWRRIEGDISTGVDYGKASDILIVNLTSNFRFREEKYEISASANWNETTRTNDQNSSRADLSSTYTRFLRDRWFWKASAGLDRNQELGIDLRGLVGATAGRYLFESPTTRFELNAGLALNRESRSDNTVSTSTEGLIRSSLDIFKHTLPVTRLSANINVFPGISESGRLRANGNISLRNEIIRSLFWDLTLYATYDNRPPEGAASEDYGIVTSIGASF